MKFGLALALLALFIIPSAYGYEESPKLVQASEILADISKGEPIIYDHIVVKGDLILDGLSLPIKHVDRTYYERSIDSKMIGLSGEFVLVRSPITITNSVIDGQTNFNDALFINAVNFRGTQFSKSQFNNTIFQENVKFNDATFRDDAWFNGSIFLKDAFFQNAKFNCSFVSFRRTSFLGNISFLQTDFSASDKLSNIDFGATNYFGKFADFGGANFSEGIANFKGANFSKCHTSFRKAIFNGSNVNFPEVKFFHSTDFFEASFWKGDANFDEASFASGDINFIGTNFSLVSFKKVNLSGQSINFDEAKFNEKVSFNEAKFNGKKIYFSNAKFYGGDTDFSNTEFAGGGVIFDGANFYKGKANFQRARFRGEYASFQNTKFPERAVFYGAIFDKEADFSDALFREYSDFNCSIFKEDALFENTTFYGNLSLTRARYNKLFIRWHKIKRDLIYDETAYLSLMKNFKDLGYLEDFDYCYLKYRREYQKQEWPLIGDWEEYIRKAADKFLDISYCYGLDPFRPIYCSLIIISIFSLFFFIFPNVPNVNYLFPKGNNYRESRIDIVRSRVISAITLSIIAFLSETKLLVDSPKIRRNWPLALKMLIYFERFLGMIFSILFIIALSMTVVRQLS